MKKIMFFRPLYYIGGTEIATLNLIKKLKGYKIYIGYTDKTSSKEVLNQFAKYGQVIDLNKECNIEFDYFIACSAHFHMIDGLKKIKRKKTYLWIHHFCNMQNSIIANKKICKNTLDGIITVSQSLTKKLIKIFPYTKSLITTIYNVLNVDEIIEKSKDNIKLKLSKELNLVTVARLDIAKGFPRMLALAKQLKEAKVDFKWFIIGDSYYTKEAKKIKKMFEPLKDNFEWFGFLDNPYKIVKQCDYSVLLSDDETWGLVLTESMILNVPCITTDFDVAFEQIEDKKNGIILNRNDSDKYKDRIKDILENKEKYKKAVQNYKYDNKRNINQWEELLHEEKIKFSIIIPNYNKEIYIKDCINSILTQTYKNYEIIFIDDKSSDNSLKNIKKYKNKNINIYSTRKRLQAGGARNLGIKKAIGEYIIFLDSDDYLTNKYVLEKLANHITNEDLIFFNYTKNDFNKITEIREKKEIINKKIANTKNLGCPTKCFKRSLIKNLSFVECKRFEDIIFTLEAMCKAKNYSIFNESFFTYRKVKNSNVTTKINEETMLDIFEEIFKIYRLCIKYPKYKLELLTRIKKDKLDLRLQVLNNLIEFDDNQFYKYFK